MNATSALSEHFSARQTYQNIAENRCLHVLVARGSPFNYVKCSSLNLRRDHHVRSIRTLLSPPCRPVYRGKLLPARIGYFAESFRLRQLLGSPLLTNTKSRRSMADLSCVYRHKPMSALRELFARHVSGLLCPHGLQTTIMRHRFLEARRACLLRSLCPALVVEHKRVAWSSLLPRSYTNLNKSSRLQSPILIDRKQA